MGGTSSTPVPADGSTSAAVVTQTPPSGCPVQRAPPAPDRTSQPSVSECPAHQDSVKLQASQCPISAGSGCDSSTMDKGDLDPTNMVTINFFYSYVYSRPDHVPLPQHFQSILFSALKMPSWWGGGGGYYLDFLLIGYWGCAAEWGHIFMTELTLMGLHKGGYCHLPSMSRVKLK